MRDDSMEQTNAFMARTLAWWKQTILQTILQHPSSETRYILVTSHGGFISTLVRALIVNQLVMPATGLAVTSGKCLNTAVAIIEVEEDGKGTLLVYGDASHLQGKAVGVNADAVGGGADTIESRYVN
jgi:2,3-bisphosphoglycerate-dependent phosphoglycerate mutase